MRARVLWFLGLAVMVGCGDNTASTTPGCTPECRSGYVCVSGTCVSSCNPPCDRNERCEGSGAMAACVSAVADAGDDLGGDSMAPADVAQDAPADVAQDVAVDATTDVPAKGDAGDAGAVDASDGGVTDAPAGDALLTDAPDGGGMDAVATDTPATTDATTDATPPADSARDAVSLDAIPPVHCGSPGEICCADVSCVPGAECLDNRCVPLSRAAAECDHPGLCPTGYACLGPQFCGDRTCYQCGVSRGTVGFGGDCTNGAMCTTGVCDRGRCTTACTIGSTGDAECAVRSAGWICTQRIYGVGQRDGSTEPMGYVTLGDCAQSCARNGDCAAGRACLPTANYLTDRISFVCNVTTRTGLAGTPCTAPEQCQSGLCIPGLFPDGGSGCTAPCVTGADCPAGAPSCDRLTLITPGGAFQMTHGCFPAI